MKNAKNNSLSYGVSLGWTVFDGMKMFAKLDQLKELQKLGAFCIDTVTNFVLTDIKVDAQEVYEKLLKQGVIVRSMVGWGMKTFIRVTIGRPEENKRFIKALKESLE